MTPSGTLPLGSGDSPRRPRLRKPHEPFTRLGPSSGPLVYAPWADYEGACSLFTDFIEHGSPFHNL